MTASAISYKIESVASIPLEVTRTADRNAARTVLLVILLAAPLAFGAVVPIAWAAMTIGVSLALVLWVISSVQQPHFTLTCSPVHLLAVTASLLGLVQLLTHRTVDPIASREALLKIAPGIVIFFLASKFFLTAAREAVHNFGYLVSAYAFAIAVFAIVQALANPSQIYWSITPRWGGYIFGPYVNHNHYAGLMELLLPLMLGFLFSRPSADPARPWLSFAAVIVFASVVLSGSRTGLVSVTIEVVAFVIVLLASVKLRPGRLATLLLLASLSAVPLYAWLAPDFLAARFQSALHSPEATYGERRNMALDSLVIMRNFPVTGSGLGTFSTIYPQFQSFVTDQQVDHAHNDYAEFLTETGIPGGAILLAALSLFAVHAWRNLRSLPRSSIDWVRIGATISCCGLLLHSFTDFNLHIPANAAWFAVCAGIAVAPSRSEAVSD